MSKRLGRVIVDIGYLVDMDDEEMLDHARDLLLGDVSIALQSDELGSHIIVVPAPEANEKDILSFLLTEAREEEKP